MLQHSMSNKHLAWRAWFSTAVCSSLTLVSYGAIALFYETITSQTGCSAAEYAFIFSMIGFGMFISNIFVGKALEINNKLFAILGGFCILLFYGSVSFSTNIIIIYIFAFIYGLLFNLCGATCFSISNTKWFLNGRAKALSIGYGIGSGASVLMNPLCARVTLIFGGRNSALMVGITFTMICVLTIAFICPRFPEYYHMEPYNWGNESIKNSSVPDDISQEGCLLPPGKIVFTSSFLLIFFSVFLLAGAVNIYLTNSVTIFQSFGMNYINAVTGTSIASAAALVLNLFSGIFIDRYGVKTVIFIYAVLGGTVCISSPILTGWSGMILFALMINCCQIYMMYGGMVVPHMFGNKNSGILMGWLQLASSFSSMLCPLIASFIYTETNSYSVSLVIIGIGVLGAACMTLIALSDNTHRHLLNTQEKYLKSQK